MSYTKYERKLMPDYRQRISSAETVPEVKNYFVHTVDNLFSDIFGGRLALGESDLQLTPRQAQPYRLSTRLTNNPEFFEVWQSSDLSVLLGRMAEMACNRCRRLEKQPEKIPSKIRK
jgi:hypothetical protein